MPNFKFYGNNNQHLQPYQHSGITFNQNMLLHQEIHSMNFEKAELSNIDFLHFIHRIFKNKYIFT